jgi:two-component system response regulator PilR (NtrC family)
MDMAILVVDDERDLTASYERLLRRQGYRVVSADSRRAGLAALPTQTWRLVIADLRLPDGDGLDVVRAARALPAPPPVLVATVLGSRASQKAALEAGATGFLAKPFTTDSLSSLVRQLIASAPV